MTDIVSSGVSDNAGVSDIDLRTLRDRIVAVLCESFPVSVDTYLGLAVADVLIREIGLMREYGVKEKGEPEPGVLSFDRDEITKYVREGDVMMRRWITDWVAD